MIMTEIEEQARSILDSLMQRPFADCVAISRSFADLPTKPGIYAVRHRSEGLLYVGEGSGYEGTISGRA
jgi:hypothetical protein